MDTITTVPLRARRSRESGFTLVELLVVVTILGVLAAIAIPVWLDQRIQAFDAAARSDLRNAATQAANRADAGDAVSTIDDLDPPHTAGVELELIAYDTALGYCLSAQHEGSPHIWYWGSLHDGIHACALDGDPADPDGAGDGAGEDAPGDDTATDHSGRGCNNGVNEGNLYRCEDFPGQGRADPGKH